MGRARQGGLRPNRRHVQRGSDVISFVLDVAGKTQSSLPIPLHPSFRTDGGGRSFCSYGLRSDINEDHAEHGPAQAYVVKGTKCAIALVAQWIERPPPERKATSPILVEGTWSGKLFRCLSSASCSPCVGSLTAECRSPKPVGVRSRLTRRARTVLFGSLLTHGFVKPNDTVPFFPMTGIPFFPFSFGMPRLISATKVDRGGGAVGRVPVAQPAEARP